MTVNRYRRHKLNCLGGHAWQSRSSELEERRKTWKRCDCSIHAPATLDRKFSRKSTGTADWELAREWARDVQAAGSWDANPVPRTAPEAPAAPAGITIADAIKVYLENRGTANVAPGTLRKYRTFTKKLQAFGDSRGYIMLDQFTATDMDVFGEVFAWVEDWQRERLIARAKKFGNKPFMIGGRGKQLLTGSRLTEAPFIRPSAGPSPLRQRGFAARDRAIG